VTAGRVVPEPDEVSAPFWEAAARHELRVARCSVCGRSTMPPEGPCPHCGTTSPAYRFEPVSGRGTVRSWTVVRQALLPGFETPYTLVDVELDDADNVRLIGQLVGAATSDLRLDAPVEVSFEDIAPGLSIPAFALAHE
jgi:uncharacterized OB-fold protein